MLLKIVYMLTCRVLGLAVLLCRGDRAKDAELLVLRHENAVLRRHAGRARNEAADRAWLAALARLIPRRRWSEVFPVTPATLLAWHRRLAAGKYDTSGRRKPGRPPKSLAISGLISVDGLLPWWAMTMFKAASRTVSPAGARSRTAMQPGPRVSCSPDRPTLFIKVSSSRFAPPSRHRPELRERTTGRWYRR